MTLSVETVSSTILLFNYTKPFPNHDKLKVSIAPNMIYLIISLKKKENRLSTQEWVSMDYIVIYKYIDHLRSSL